MDAKSTNVECTCELCSPNWYLGRNDEFVVAPVPVPDCELVTRHALKLRKAGLLREAALNLQPQPA